MFKRTQFLFLYKRSYIFDVEINCLFKCENATEFLQGYKIRQAWLSANQNGLSFSISHKINRQCRPITRCFVPLPRCKHRRITSHYVVRAQILCWPNTASTSHTLAWYRCSILEHILCNHMIPLTNAKNGTIDIFQILAGYFSLFQSINFTCKI